MKQLYITRGVPGCGKSTFLRKKLGESYSSMVLEPDLLRQMFGTLDLGVNGESKVSQKNDKLVWKTLMSLLEHRMKNGDTTIIDTTHTTAKGINAYKSLCQQYEYDLFVLDFSNVPKELCLERNMNRELYKRVPTEVITRMHENLKLEENSIPKWCTPVDPNSFQLEFQPLKDKYRNYEKVVFFGDIHGCMEPLKEYLDKTKLNSDTLYVFTGDYIDRGIQNKKVLQFLLLHLNESNVKLLKGNHEKWLWLFAQDKIDQIKSKEFLENTLPQLEGLNKSDLRQLCRKMQTFMYFSIGEQNFVVSHGGINTLPNILLKESDYISGIGGYPDSDAVDEEFRRRYPNIIQVHGHRNVNGTPIQVNNSFNLEGKVEFGGHLRIVEWDKSTGIKTYEIKNSIYKDLQSNEEIIKSLRTNIHIQEKKY